MQYTLLLLLSFAFGCAPQRVASQDAAEAYTPVSAPCPANVSLVRDAGVPGNQSLSSAESAYVSARRSTILPDAWKTYLASVQQTSTSLPPYVSDILTGAFGSDALPKFGIATSGGGYRAATFGAGILNALDSRNTSSVVAGTGGLLQAASYLAGLSGGSWLVTSLAQANFPTLPDLILGPANVSSDGYGGWIAEIDLLEPSNDTLVEDSFVVDLILEVEGKYTAGFPVTLTDVWARTLSRHFVNGTTADNFWNIMLTHGAGYTFSGIAEVDTFAAYEQPFPLVVTDSLSPNGNTSNYVNQSDIFVPLTNPIYEVNVFEFGSYDPMLAAFTPTQYLGSPGNGTCVTGYDQICFIEALSSNLFNEYNTSAATLADSTAGEVIDVLEVMVPETGIEYVAGLVPNPFQGVKPETFIDTNETYLQLVDGGEDGEVVPLMPLLVKARDIDVIFAIDAASDTDDNWTNGESIMATQARIAFFPSVYSFPPVPSSASVYVSENLTTHPTFFGCNSSASSGDPLVIYLANGGPPLGQTPLTNTSTSQMTYTSDELTAMLSQTFDIATQGISTETADGWQKDPEWPTCLACAVVDRARRQEGIERSGACASCLDRYCWS